MSKYTKPDGQSPPHLQHSFCRHVPHKSHGEAATAWHTPEMEVRGCQRQRGDPKGHGHSPCSHPSQDPQGRESIPDPILVPLPHTQPPAEPCLGSTPREATSHLTKSQNFIVTMESLQTRIPYKPRFKQKTQHCSDVLKHKKPQDAPRLQVQEVPQLRLSLALQPGEHWALLPAEASPPAWIHTPAWLRTAAFATGTENPLWAEWHH